MITDTQRDLIIERDTGLGYCKEEIRSYEVSLWTLQDSFMTVLKWSDIEQAGRIEEPKMRLNVDGTEEFTFSIPMYIWSHGEKIENPNWYTVREQKLLENMRKIKVWFNKSQTETPHIFEFLIVNVSEEHEDDSLICNVKCEGLAFNELGKIGYQYSLSPEVFYNEMEEWYKYGITDKPKQNIDYWCTQLDLPKLPSNTSQCNARTWYYDVQMNWSGYQSPFLRDSKVIYEEAYATEWNNELQPLKVVEYREKERPISVEKSNLYNITQNIAETFGVFCRYEYLHNDNGQIIGRRIIFYNNYFSEETNGMITLNYPHYTNNISREIDSSNLTTKLYVSDVDAPDTYEGVYSIMNADCNMSHENYLLNFDYMLEIGAISQDEYKEIPKYYKKVKTINEALMRLQNNRDAYEQEILDLEAKLAICKKNIDTATEELSQNQNLLNKLTGNTGYIVVDENRPDQSIIIPDAVNGNYIKLNDANKGIVPGTIHVYSQYDTANKVFVASSEITNFTVETDEYGNAKRIIGITLPAGSSVVFLSYQYSPQLYYEAIINLWNTTLGEGYKEKEDLQTKLGTKNNQGDGTSGLYLLYTDTCNTIESLLEELKETRKEFERLMGPALREGYWQPDDYADYGDQREQQLDMPTNIANSNLSTDTGKDIAIGWDSELFDGEDSITYYVGQNKTPEAYPCIDLSSVLNTMLSSNYDLTDYSFMFVNNTLEENPDETSIKNLTVYKIGSKALVRFIERNNNIVPILVLVGAKNLTDDQLKWLYQQQSKSKPKLGIINGTVSSGIIASQVVPNTSISLIGQSYWINNLSASNLRQQITYPVVELRLKCSSLEMKTDVSSLSIKYKYGNSDTDYVVIQPYTDYYINTRNIQHVNSTTNETYYAVEQFITIKPMIFMKHGWTGQCLVDYVISNASISIYQDATNVLKENSKPKVSYSITPTILNHDFSKELYSKLAQIVMINDTDLKLVESFGYISELELDLDDVSQDSIVIQNYTSKFEDLFSSIVASTESLNRAKGGYSAAASGNVPLTSAGLSDTLAGSLNIIQAYLDSYFDGSEVVEKKLTSLFTEAAAILGDANQSLTYTRALSTENAAILSGLVQNAEDMLRIQEYTGENKPLHFKIGDIWRFTKDGVDYTYVAITNSEDAPAGGTGGFTRTYDGSLAAINGASLDVDAAAGTVNIKAKNTISLNSGGNIEIQAHEDVYIHGNKKVDISGTNLYLTTEGGSTSGISLLSTGYSSSGYTSPSYSRILLNPSKILLAGAEIDMLASSASNAVSAVTIKGTGIELASTGSIKLMAGALSANNSTVSGGNVEIDHSKLFLSYYNATSANASCISLDENGMVLASGNTLVSSQNITNNTGLTGVKITKNSIGLSIGAGDNRTAFLMDGNGLTLGSGSINVASNSITGSYIRLTSNKLEFGSKADLYINTNNCKLQTNVNAANNSLGNTIFALGTNLNNITSTTDPSTLDADSTVNFLVNQNGAYIKGRVYATGGNFNGSVYATSFQLAPGQSIPYSQISGTPTIPDPADFTIDGITGPVTWNGKTYNVCLSSSNALLIGVNGSGNIVDGGITIADSANHAAVDITRAHINFDYNASNYIHINSSGITMKGSRMTINDKQVFASDNIVWGSETERNAAFAALRNSNYSGQFIWIKPDAGTMVHYGAADNITCSSGAWTARTIDSGVNHLTGATNATYVITVHCAIGVEMTNSDADQGTYTRYIYVDSNANGSSSIQLPSTAPVYLTRYDANYSKAVVDYKAIVSGSNINVRNLVNSSTIYVNPQNCDYAYSVEVSISVSDSSGAAQGSLCTVYYYNSVPSA